MKNATRSRILFFFCLFVISSSARAQYVSASQEVVEYIHDHIDSACVTLDYNNQIFQLDTTCPALMNVKSLNFSLSTGYITPDLSGVQYFKHLDTLICTDGAGNLTAFPPSLKVFYLHESGMSTLPPLPDSITYLVMSDATNLSQLPALPSTLKYLDCNNGEITSLPALPSGLEYLDCHWNRISNLTLPASLKYLNCDANQMTSLSIPSSALDTMICSNNYLTSLFPLGASMKYLDCQGNSSLHNVPSLPSTLLYLDCSNDSLAVVPAIPASVIHLACSTNQLTTLPTLPAGLRYLDCSYNHLPMLQSNLPATLTYLNCQVNVLSGLPTLPSFLQALACGANYISTLPALPATLTLLSCSGNPLTFLPALPPSLDNLTAEYDSLTSLPALPSSLTILYCDHNQLVHLPSMPAYLRALYCSSNQLLDLPSLPETLRDLSCSYNPLLSCLPRFGYSPNAFSLDILGTNIQCLPNALNTNMPFDPYLASLPFCTPASGCDFYYNIEGNVHSDTSATCTLDSLSPGSPLHNVKVMLKQNGQVIQQAYVYSSGAYSFKTDSLITYEVAVDTSLLPLTLSCPSTGVRSVALSSIDTVSFDQNFGLTCSDADYSMIGMWSGRFRPGFSTPLFVYGGNATRLKYGADCGAAISGTVTTTISGSASYIAAAAGSLTPSSISGPTLTYNIADLGALNGNEFNIILSTDSSAAIGTSICVTSIITPATPDVNPADDTLTHCFSVMNSLDPNLKEVYPTTLTTQGDWLTYTIHFQNTGNDTAYTVVVRDTLSSYVDASSFQYIASSHKAVVQLFGNAMAFTFPKINLVDSATNPPLSEGWIQYKVKAKANLPLTTQVKNTAYIYFDFNPAVVTNTAVSTVDVTGIPAIADHSFISLYPNPNKGSFTLQTSNSLHSDYTITDMLGHVIQQRTITADRLVIDMSSAAAGVYTLVVKGAEPLRFVVVK